MIKLDEKDRKLLYQLDLDSRRSLKQLARKIGVSKQVVSYRINRFLERGLIKKFYAIYDMSKLGFQVIKLYIRFGNTWPEKEKEIINYLCKEEKVGWLVRGFGIWDINVALYVRDVNEFNDFVNRFLSKYDKYIVEKEIANVLEAYQFRKAYIDKKKTDTSKYDYMFSRKKPAKLNKKDMILLKELTKDGRAEIKTLAEKSGMSVKTVVKRISKFKKEGVIQSFRPMIDLNKLGYRYYKVFLYLNNFTPEKEKKLFGFLRSHPNIVYVTKSAGKADYEFEMNIQTEEQAIKIMDKLKNNFKHMVNYYDILHYYQEHKFLYFPV